LANDGSSATANPDESRLSLALVGRYRIERELGAGGMATVYLAEDLKHKRKVAVKVLKPELAAVLGAERFVQEIKTTAALQHPHILPLFDSGEADGFLYYVMPFIDGETLRAKLDRETQLGVDESVKITTAVADALDYAHRHGVIHRDIKPENILLHEGRPVVADFGIALAVSAAAGGRMTETGLSLGTPHYMSPEQATAEKDISARSDVYSLASVLYEMLTGDPPHTGASAQQIIMKIITEPAAPVATLRKSVPANVAAAVAKSLEKLPADRFETAKAFGEALNNPAFRIADGVGSLRGANRAPSVSRRAFAGTAAIAVLATTGFVWALANRKPAIVADEPVIRAAVDLPSSERLYPALGSTIAISPQGDRLAFVAIGGAGAHLMTRRTADLAARELTPSVVTQPAFSPDGRWIVYGDGERISKVSIDGGSSIPLANAPNNVRGLYWTNTDTVLIGSDFGILAFPSRGGSPRNVAGVDTTIPAVFPVLLPDGKTLAYATGTAAASRRLAVISLASHRTTVLETVGVMVVGMRDGHLLYVTNSGELNAIPFDLEAQRVTGDAIRIEGSVRVTTTGAALASLSANGALWYVTGQPLSHLVRVAAGRPEVRLLDEPRAFRSPRLSPDGRKVAVEVTSTNGSNIWVLEFANGTFTPLTSDANNNSLAEWSGDGRRVLFKSTHDGKQAVWWRPADGSRSAELLYQPADPFNEAVMSPDGKWLLYRTSPGPHNRDIYAVPLEGDRKPILLVGGPPQESHPRVSPDGKWLAYQSDESGRFEVYVRPFPNPGARSQVSNQGGAEPIWSKSGNAILYRTLNGGIESAAVAAGTTFAVGERRALLQAGDYLNDIMHASYDVWPDGVGFIMVKPAGGDARPILVHNWGRELRDKLAGGKR
jgi:serine/threonine-protein kinase